MRAHFSTVDARGLRANYVETDVALFFHKGSPLGIYKDKPFEILTFLGYQKQPDFAFAPFTPSDVSHVRHLDLRRLSIYKVNEQGFLTFVRNVVFDPTLVHWIQKKTGRYVIFAGTEEIHGLEITKQAVKYKDPIQTGWPISHRMPSAAWY